MLGAVFVVVKPRSYESRIHAVAGTLEKAKELCLDGVQQERSFPLSDGWWVESEKQGEREAFGEESGFLSLYDFGYADTGWQVEWRAVEE